MEVYLVGLDNIYSSILRNQLSILTPIPLSAETRQSPYFWGKTRWRAYVSPNKKQFSHGPLWTKQKRERPAQVSVLQDMHKVPNFERCWRSLGTEHCRIRPILLMTFQSVAGINHNVTPAVIRSLNETGKTLFDFARKRSVPSPFCSEQPFFFSLDKKMFFLTRLYLEMLRMCHPLQRMTGQQVELL